MEEPFVNAFCHMKRICISNRRIDVVHCSVDYDDMSIEIATFGIVNANGDWLRVAIHT